MNILAIIPARGGSKRLPRKNFLQLAGKPLLAWSIDAARDSTCFSRIVVSSDAEEALAIARERGVDCLLRPDELATDVSSSVDVVRHALETYHREGIHFDAVALMQPTSPLRADSDIRGAVDLFRKKGASSVVSMSQCEHPPSFSTQLDSASQLDFFYEKLNKLPKRSQDFPPFFRLNGAFYIVRTANFMREGSFFCSPGYAYIMPADRSIDVDTEIDFLTCQSLLGRKNS